MNINTINIQPLSGHPFTIKARLASRSTHELLNMSPNNNKRKQNNNINILLTHPPVLLIQNEGGEQLLNRDSVSLQLNFNQKKLARGITMPESLVVFLIEKENITGELMMLMRFLFGPLQRIYYEKKDATGNLNWQQAISIIGENNLLKSCIEKELFNGEELTARHYMQLLRGANLSASSIGHMPGVKKKEKNKFDLNHSLEKLKNAAELGEKNHLWNARRDEK